MVGPSLIAKSGNSSLMAKRHTQIFFDLVSIRELGAALCRIDAVIRSLITSEGLLCDELPLLVARVVDLIAFLTFDKSGEVIHTFAVDWHGFLSVTLQVFPIFAVINSFFIVKLKV